MRSPTGATESDLLVGGSCITTMEPPHSDPVQRLEILFVVYESELYFALLAV